MKQKIMLLLFLFGMSVSIAEAALSLSISPFSGGSTLRLGRVDSFHEVNEQVRIRISSTDGKQYQVFQRLQRPLVNERGHVLTRDAIKSYSLSGSNGSGSLYIQIPESLTSSDQLIYTSAPSGESDSFVIIYNVDAKRLDGSGQFNGSISYSVRPFGSGSQDTAILNVSLDASGELQVEVKSSSGSDRVKVITAPNTVSEEVTISYENPFGGVVRVYQEMDGLPRSVGLESLRSESIDYQTLGDTDGSLSALIPVPLEARRSLLYEGNANQDQFYVRYLLNTDAGDLPVAGEYRSVVRYYIEAGGESVVKTLTLEADVDALFQLDITLPPGGVQFQRLMPYGPEQRHEVLLNVASNTGKRYQITQEVASPMTTPSGNVLDATAFEVRQDVLAGEGKAESGKFIPVRVGKTPVYVSDSHGSSAEVKVEYRLTPYATMKAGDYTTMIQFSLSEL